MAAATVMMDAHLQGNPVAACQIQRIARPTRAQRRARQKAVARASSSVNAVAAPPLNGSVSLQNGAKHTDEWRPDSWRQLEAKQQPTYPDQVTYLDSGCGASDCKLASPSSWPPSAYHLARRADWHGAGAQETLQRAVDTVRRMPPLVFAGECRTLQERLAQCAAGNAFMLQVRSIIRFCPMCCGSVTWSHS